MVTGVAVSRTGWFMDSLTIDNSRASARRFGTILLEVVLAVTLFVAMAAVILTAVGRATDAAVRMRLRAQAADLAVTLMSELRMGLVECVDAGPAGYSSERLADWTWQVDVEPIADPIRARQVKAIVAHAPTGLTRTLACVMADAGGEEGG